jgi:hypothetical protein
MISDACYSDNLRPALAYVNNRPERTSRRPERWMIYQPDRSFALYHVNWGVRSTAHFQPSLTRIPELAVPRVVTALTSPQPANKASRYGSRTLTVTPQKNEPGSVDETVTYTLNATNHRGGGETRTVALHIVGRIEPGALAMRSVYFPTDLPTNLMSDGGLLPSEQEELKTVAEEFKKYLAYKSDARLVLAGHADRRGPDSHGEMRERVTKQVGNIAFVYNRRVDLTLISTGQESAHAYPFSAEDFARLAERDPKKGPAPYNWRQKRST